YIMPQLARGLSLTPAIRYFQITSRRKSRESCFRLRVLLTSEPKSCRNSREDYLLLELFAACEPDYAATRVGTVLSYGHILLPNHIAPQLEQEPSHTRVTSYLLLRIHSTMPQLAQALSLAAKTLLANRITPQLARNSRWKYFKFFKYSKFFKWSRFFNYSARVHHPHHILLPNHITPQLALKILLTGSLPTFHSPLPDNIMRQAAQRLPIVRCSSSERISPQLVVEKLESDVFLEVPLSIVQPGCDVRHLLAMQARWMSLLEVSPPTSKSRRKSRRTYWRLQLLLNHCSLPPNQPAKCVTLKLRMQAVSLDLSSLSQQHPATTRVEIAVDCRHFSVVVLATVSRYAMCHVESCRLTWSISTSNLFVQHTPSRDSREGYCQRYPLTRQHFLWMTHALPSVTLEAVKHGEPLAPNVLEYDGALAQLGRVEICLGLMPFTDQRLLDRSHALSPFALNLIRTFSLPRSAPFFSDIRSAEYVEEVYSTQHLVPNGALCTPGASSSLASTYGDFHTPSQGSAMKFLNAGSTAEGSSTKRSSLSPVKPVGSGFSSPSRVSAPLVQGPVFSTDTDTDPNTSETRFVCFDLIPEQWTQDSAEGCTGLIGLIDTAVGSPSEVPGFTLFETVVTTAAFNFISHHEYFGADHTEVAPCLICPPRWSVRIAVSPLTTARLFRALCQTGLIGLLDLMVSPSNGTQPSTHSAEHNPWAFGSAMNATDFGECFDYDVFIRCLGSLRASASGT
ncbi:unnamed protein product, partial [Aureobasidium pullulans]